jgi:drug/metabolite transporter (DMT)-like permease
MLSDLSVVFFGLLSAASWGAGDFSGGLASKRSDVYNVVAFSQMFGVTLLMALAILFSEAMPSAGDMLLGAIAGIFGALGLVALYAGLAGGRMGVVAPVTAVVTAAVPVIFSIFLEGLPAGRQMAGFGLAFIAVWLLSYAGHGAVFQVKDLALPVASGLGFGVFLLLIGRASQSAILWPLVAARLASISLILVLAARLRRLALPASTQLPLIALAGILDAGGNAFFALAARAGRLDIAAILASLYPAITVLLAWLILGERLIWRQWLGLIASLAAVFLIAG